jgi:hypothetical protein
MLCPASLAVWLQPVGACAYVTWLCGCLNDPRIANPDVQESLLQVRSGHHVYMRSCCAEACSCV